jgi:hypothetical protein
VEAAARARTDYISSEVLARDVTVGGALPDLPVATQDAELDGLVARIAFTRVP